MMPLRTAYDRKYMNCAGDRPIQITVERVWKSLDWKSKLRLVKLILNGLFRELPKISPADVEKIDSDDAVDAMTKQLTTAFPQVHYRCSIRSSPVIFKL